MSGRRRKPPPLPPKSSSRLNEGADDDADDAADDRADEAAYEIQDCRQREPTYDQPENRRVDRTEEQPRRPNERAYRSLSVRNDDSTNRQPDARPYGSLRTRTDESAHRRTEPRAYGSLRSRTEESSQRRANNRAYGSLRRHTDEPAYRRADNRNGGSLRGRTEEPVYRRNSDRNYGSFHGIIDVPAYRVTDDRIYSSFRSGTDDSGDRRMDDQRHGPQYNNTNEEAYRPNYDRTEASVHGREDESSFRWPDVQPYGPSSVHRDEPTYSRPNDQTHENDPMPNATYERLDDPPNNWDDYKVHDYANYNHQDYANQTGQTYAEYNQYDQNDSNAVNHAEDPYPDYVQYKHDENQTAEDEWGQNYDYNQDYNLDRQHHNQIEHPGVSNQHHVDPADDDRAHPHVLHHQISTTSSNYYVNHPVADTAYDFVDAPHAHDQQAVETRASSQIDNRVRVSNEHPINVRPQRGVNNLANDRINLLRFAHAVHNETPGMYRDFYRRFIAREIGGGEQGDELSGGSSGGRSGDDLWIAWSLLNYNGVVANYRFFRSFGESNCLVVNGKRIPIFDKMDAAFFDHVTEEHDLIPASVKAANAALRTKRQAFRVSPQARLDETERDAEFRWLLEEFVVKIFGNTPEMLVRWRERLEAVRCGGLDHRLTETEDGVTAAAVPAENMTLRIRETREKLCNAVKELDDLLAVDGGVGAAASETLERRRKSWDSYSIHDNGDTVGGESMEKGRGKLRERLKSEGDKSVERERSIDAKPNKVFILPPPPPISTPSLSLPFDLIPCPPVPHPTLSSRLLRLLRRHDWSSTPRFPVGRGFVAVVLDGVVVLWGGAQNRRGDGPGEARLLPGGVVFVLDPGPPALSWRRIVASGDVPPDTASSAFVAWRRNLACIFGGVVDGDKNTNEAYTLSVSGVFRRLIPVGHAPPPRQGHGAWTSGGAVFFFGGFGPKEGAMVDGADWIPRNSPDDDDWTPRTFFNNQIVKLDPEARRFSIVQTSGPKPSPRANFAVAETEDKVYFHGGLDDEGALADFHVLDTPTGSWTSLVFGLPRGVFYHSLDAITPSRLLLVGGDAGGVDGVAKEVFVFDVEDQSWTQLENLPAEFCGERGGLKFHQAVTLETPEAAESAQSVASVLCIGGFVDGAFGKHPKHILVLKPN